MRAGGVKVFHHHLGCLWFVFLTAHFSRTELGIDGIPECCDGLCHRHGCLSLVVSGVQRPRCDTKMGRT